MTNIANVTETVDNFSISSSRYFEHVENTGEPVVLTAGGEAKFVIQDIVSYRKLLQLCEEARAVVGIQQSLADIQSGDVMPLDDAFESIYRDHGIPDHHNKDRVE